MKRSWLACCSTNSWQHLWCDDGRALLTIKLWSDAKSNSIFIWKQNRRRRLGRMRMRLQNQRCQLLHSVAHVLSCLVFEIWPQDGPTSVSIAYLALRRATKSSISTTVSYFHKDMNMNIMLYKHWTLNLKQFNLAKNVKNIKFYWKYSMAL